MTNYRPNSCRERVVITVFLVCFPLTASSQPLDSGLLRSDVESRSYFSYAQEVVDNLIEHGTDRYGSVQSNLLVSNLDVRTEVDIRPAPDLAAADEFWRVERRQRRAPGGANFLHNQSVYSAIQRVGLDDGVTASSSRI